MPSQENSTCTKRFSHLLGPITQQSPQSLQHDDDQDLDNTSPFPQGIGDISMVGVRSLIPKVEMKCGSTHKLDPSQALWHKHQHLQPHREHLKFLTTYTGTNAILRKCTTKILTPITHQSPRSPQTG